MSVRILTDQELTLLWHALFRAGDVGRAEQVQAVSHVARRSPDHQARLIIRNEEMHCYIKSLKRDKDQTIVYLLKNLPHPVPLIVEEEGRRTQLMRVLAGEA